ncbi:YugN family protein [Paenibacillus ginsengarvi]|uniref:YugN family protein n=1 Tax=Paenibacillus ginsengarvi TaxID=400777 RepID=UPI003B83754C
MCALKPIHSALDGRMEEYDRVYDYLQQHQFTLGGNWEYDHGSFDHALDEANKVWLRLPFEVTRGRLESADAPNPGTRIMMGTPFVLKHLYNEGLDDDATMRTYGALFDQFQAPVDEDAKVEDHWVTRGEQLLRKVEQGLL